MASIFKLLLFVFVIIHRGNSLQHEGNNSSSGVFDVTKYGAAPGNRDNKEAFSEAWRAACKLNGSATLLIPEGTFVLSAVQFSGPCNSSGAPDVRIDGVLQPPAGACEFPGGQWIHFTDLNNLTVTGGGTLNGRANQTRPPKLTTTLKFTDVTNSTVQGLKFTNSMGFHVNFHRCQRIMVQDLEIRAPATSHNTDGIHVGLSKHVSITDCVIATGDDCVSIGPGSRNVVVTGVTCGPGHGISIGSLGRDRGEEDVGDLLIQNCTLNGTTNGLRIKTWPRPNPSRASNITFQDITLINVDNPILIDQRYCPHGACEDINKPSQVQVSNVAFKEIAGSSTSEDAVQLVCSRDWPCNGVLLQNIDLNCNGGPCRAKFSNVRGTASGILMPQPLTLIQT